MIGIVWVVGVVAAAQPQEFHAAFGMEEGTVYRLRVHQYSVADSKVTRDADGEFELVYEGTNAESAFLVRTRQIETDEIAAGAAAMGLQSADPLGECEFVIAEDWAVTLRNWEELGAQLRDASDRMYAHRVAQGLLTQEEADAVAAILAQLTATHEGVLGAYGKLVLLYLPGYGYMLTEVEAIEAPREIANPFGGGALAGVETVELRDCPETPELACGNTRVTGRESLEALIREIVSKLSVEDREEFEEEVAAEMERAQLTDRTYERGLVVSGRSERVWRTRHPGDVFEEVSREVERIETESDHEAGKCPGTVPSHTLHNMSLKAPYHTITRIGRQARAGYRHYGQELIGYRGTSALHSSRTSFRSCLDRTLAETGGKARVTTRFTT